MNPNPNPNLTRAEYQALRRAYRCACREDVLAASSMPILSSEWRMRHRQSSAISPVIAGLDLRLVETLRRHNKTDIRSPRLLGRLDHYFRGKRIAKALADARLAIAEHEAELANRQPMRLAA